MNIVNLVERINEDSVGGDIANAVTNNSNPSIAYLPGGFTHMRNMLNSLSIVKKQWNLDILEEGGNYKVNFEDAMSITIPKKDYKEFNTKVLNILDKKEVDLTGMINEARSEEVHRLYAKLNKLLTANLREIPQIKKTLVTMNYWLSIFPTSKFLTMNNATLINLNNYDNDIRVLMSRIQNIYEDDIGNLEILAKTIQDKRPLNAYEPFSEYDFVVGVRVQSEYNGVLMILELTVNNALVPSQSLYIESQSTLDELEAYHNIKVLKNIVFPVGGSFNVNMFQNIKDTIKDVGDAEDA